MSAIGDYIHNTAYGYNVYGINYRGLNPQSDSEKMAVFALQYNKVIQKARLTANMLQKKDKELLEKKITWFMKRPTIDTEQEEYDRIWKIFKEVMLEEFFASADSICQETANIIISDPGLRFQGTKYRPRKEKGQNLQTKNTLVTTLTKRIEQINQAMSKIGVSRNTQQELEKNIEIVEKLINNLKIFGLQTVNFSLIPDLMSLGKNVLKEVTTANIVGLGSLVDSLNKIIGLLRGSINMQKGKLMEMLVAAVPVKGAQMSKNALKKYLKQILKENESAVTFLGDLFSDEINMSKVLTSGYKNLVGNTWVATKESPDKVDISIEWRDRLLPISVKNYNMSLDSSSSTVHLLSSASLLALLSSFGSEYTNHYLNVVSKHRNLALRIGGVRSTIGSYLQQLARESVRISILLAALLGYKSNAKGGKALVFIINDNSTGRVKIYNINELILRVLLNGQFLSQSVVLIKANKKNIDELTFENKMVNPEKLSRESAYLRITDLLHAVHQQKISVAMNKAMFFEFY